LNIIFIYIKKKIRGVGQPSVFYKAFVKNMETFSSPFEVGFGFKRAGPKPIKKIYKGITCLPHSSSDLWLRNYNLILTNTWANGFMARVIVMINYFFPYHLEKNNKNKNTSARVGFCFYFLVLSLICLLAPSILYVYWACRVFNGSGE